MRSVRLKSALAIVMAMGFAISIGCIFNPKPDDSPDPGPKIDWGDLTKKDDCINNMLLAYKHRDKQHYAELLMPDKYLWYLQDEDAIKYNTQTLDYAQDIAGTYNIFDKAVVLYLDLEGGSWSEIPEVGEEPCNNCWQIEKIYTIQVQFLGNETIYMGHDNVVFIVVPYEDTKDGRMEWRIRWAFDLDKQG